MRNKFCKVELNLSMGSAYEYNITSKIPTIIKFGRRYDGKFQRGKIKGNFTNDELHNIVFRIKGGVNFELIKKT